MISGARSFAVFCLAGLLFAAGGCFRVQVHAPLGKDVSLLAAEDQVETTKEYRTWYTLFGWYTLDERMPHTVIDDEYLSEARVLYEGTLEDAFISFVSSVPLVIGILPQTLTVEGNRGYLPRPDDGTPPEESGPSTTRSSSTGNRTSEAMPATSSSRYPVASPLASRL